MRTAKFYKVERTGDGGKKIRVVKARVSKRGSHTAVARSITPDGRVLFGQSSRCSYPDLEDRMLSIGFSRRRATKPHDFREQRPGYRQPTEQQKRFARQQFRKAP